MINGEQRLLLVHDKLFVFVVGMLVLGLPALGLLRLRVVILLLFLLFVLVLVEAGDAVAG